MTDWTAMQHQNQELIDQFRNGGRVEGPFTAPLIILHTVGARSGKTREVPVVGFPQNDGTVVVAASKAGAPTNPDWYHNLKAHPRLLVEVGAERATYDAVELTGAERDAVWGNVVATMSRFADYQSETTRLIPLVRLTKRSS